MRANNYINGLSAAYATALYKGTPVTLNTSGQIVIGAVSAADILGSFAGVEYTDPTGRRVVSDYWPAAQAVLANTETWVWVYDDPLIVYTIQADGAVAQAAIGDQANFSATAGYLVTSGSTLTGRSSTAINATLAGAAAQGTLRIIGKDLSVDNEWGDAYTKVQVQIARHVYVGNKVAI
jgi:hypothetical protein